MLCALIATARPHEKHVECGRVYVWCCVRLYYGVRLIFVYVVLFAQLVGFAVRAVTSLNYRVIFGYEEPVNSGGQKRNQTLHIRTHRVGDRQRENGCFCPVAQSPRIYVIDLLMGLNN